ncbi:MAG: GntR family transcriptional regulator [Thermomicrobiales bacterium]
MAKTAAATSSVTQVYKRLRESITRGDHQPGAPLRLQELALTYGVSMIPVREALRRLEAEEFVEIIPNKGARVAPLSAADLHDVYGMRMLIEAEALRLAFPKIDATTLDTARRLNEQMEAALRQGDPAAHKAHRALHFALYEPAESRWLIRLVGILWDHCERYRRLATDQMGADALSAEHTRLFDLVAAGDLNGALTHLRSHIQWTVDILRRLYDEIEEPVPYVPDTVVDNLDQDH